MKQRTLNIIGCGRLGKTLGYLFNKNSLFKVQNILNRTLESSKAAAQFIKAGDAISSYEEMREADVYLISTSDDSILSCMSKLQETNLLNSESIVFHCSGVLSSKLLKNSSVKAASIHPFMSFPSAEIGIESFTGTYCAVEGESAALNVLLPSFEKIGANIIEINSENKAAYHTATVLSSNYIPALLESALQIFSKAGISRERALQSMRPIVEQTIKNVFESGTAESLSGPILRGDKQTIETHLELLDSSEPLIAQIYKALGLVALELVEAKNLGSAEKNEEIKTLLKSQS